MQKMGILVDTTLCIGCYACEDACAERWGFPKQPEVHELSAVKNTIVQQWDDVYVPRMCMHCEEPTCVSVCPVAAFTKTKEGAVVYDADKCMGCRYCMQACPFQVPRYQWNNPNPKVMKCDMCHERTSKGGVPACVEICPVQARIFGPREDLMQEAHKRIRENPSYYNAVFGELEAGGTSVLYLANRAFDKIGFKTSLPKQPLPELTWGAMSKIPNYVFWGGTLLTGIWWITNRRKDVAEYERREKEAELKAADRTNGNHH